MTKFSHAITMTIVVILICVVIGSAIWFSFQTVGSIYVAHPENTRDSSSGILSMLLSLRLVLILVLLVLVAIGVVLVVEYRYFRENTRRLEREVNSDMLTGADSRRYGCDCLAEAFKEFQESGVSTAIFAFDLDRLKAINDAYGHKMGDQVLQAVVQAVYQNIPDSGCVIRWGGDEFLALLQGVEKHEIRAFGTRLVEAVANLKLQSGSEAITPSMSLGATFFSVDDAKYADALNRADRALYQAKESGKNRACFADCDAS